MPRVNGKEFPYTAEGMREAKAYANKVGKKLTHADKASEYDKVVYKKGGKVKSYSGGGSTKDKLENILLNKAIKRILPSNLTLEKGQEGRYDLGINKRIGDTQLRAGIGGRKGKKPDFSASFEKPISGKRRKKRQRRRRRKGK